MSGLATLMLIQETKVTLFSHVPYVILRVNAMYLVYLVVLGNVLVKCSKHNHGHHAGQEKNDDQ